MHSTSAVSRSPTPEDQWSRDFANSFYQGRPPKREVSPTDTTKHGQLRVFDQNDADYNRHKYEHKRSLYMRKYRGTFDENKLPQYLRSFEAFMSGREEFLRNRGNIRPPLWHRDMRQNTASPQNFEREKNEFTDRPLISLRRTSSPYNHYERRFNREFLSRSRSGSRSRSSSPLRRSPSPSFSRSRSRTPPPTRYRPAALRSPTRSWSRSPPGRSFGYRGGAHPNGGGRSRVGPRTPSNSPPPSREHSQGSSPGYSHRGQPLPPPKLKVRPRTPPGSPPHSPLRSLSQTPPPPLPARRRVSRGLLKTPSRSPTLHANDHQPPSLLSPHILLSADGEPIASTSRAFLQHPVVASVKPEIRIALKGQLSSSTQPKIPQQQQQATYLLSPPAFANSTINPTAIFTPPPQPVPHPAVQSVVEQYQAQSTTTTAQVDQNLDAPPIPGAVPLDDTNDADEANSLIDDFHKLPNRPYFVKGERYIYFTPCLATFYENICTAWKELKYPPRFFDAITSYSDTRRQTLARSLEATIVLAVGQSCALSYNLTADKKSTISDQLIKAELPVLKAFRMIASQYGSVKCTQTGDFLKPIDHTGDIRAIVRMSAHLLPEVVKGIKENGQPEKELIVLSDAEGRNVAVRSWLPTYPGDPRFFWIIALKIKDFMKNRLGIFPQPIETVRELSSSRRTIPPWWGVFRELLPREANGRFDFLWYNWNDATFYENLGAHPAGSLALQAIGLTWPAPEQSHLYFNINLREEIPRIYRYIFKDLELYVSNFKVMVMQQLGPAHYGSWNQLASVINFMGWNVFKNCRETDKAWQNLALRFPPRVYHDYES